MNRLLTALAILPLWLSPSQTFATDTAQKGSAYDFTFQSIEGKPLQLSDFRGKVVLVVNVASFCGYTYQYAGLQALYAADQAKGLVVLGVPSNDFGEQEPGSNAEIVTFCQGAFNVTFPLTEKYSVKGDAAHPFYAWARETLGDKATPRWNFHKYLIGRDGKLIAAFASNIEPNAPDLQQAIDAALARPAS